TLHSAVLRDLHSFPTRRSSDLADYVTVNDYESNLLQERTGWDEKTIAGKVKAYIATRGPKGAVIFADGKAIDVPPAHERRVTDRSEEHTSELQSRENLVCRLLL